MPCYPKYLEGYKKDRKKSEDVPFLERAFPHSFFFFFELDPQQPHAIFSLSFYILIACLAILGQV
jgi:hypothetical protein